jgi:hypothetical protein
MIPLPEGLNFIEENRNGKQCEMDNSSVSDDIREIVDGDEEDVDRFRR